MAEALLPTTRAQVSGHKFLQRRVEHALVFGDLRMIHDPLARRHRALLFGVTAMVLIGLGAGLLALLRPAADPGQAPILRADSGALLVRLDDTLHPVANLSSARLLAGESADPARISDEVLGEQSLGPPVGITEAPGVLPTDPAPVLTWSVCEDPRTGQVAVVAQAAAAPVPLSEQQAVLLRVDARDHLLTSAGRRLLPAADTPEGRVVRRRLEITAQTPVWQPVPEVARVIRELAPVAVPEGELQVHTAAGQDWLDVGQGLLPVTPLQRDILADLGTAVSDTPRQQLALLADDPDPPRVDLPTRVRDWVDPPDQALCATGESGLPGTLPRLPAGVGVAGDSVAGSYSGPLGSVLVDTGSGWRVVGETGTVHQVAGPEVAAVLGLTGEPSRVPWQILRLLPQGAELSTERAAMIRNPAVGDAVG